MDEPFGALDVQTRAIMSNELLTLWDQSKPSVIFVTHDLEEAIALADRVVVMTAGPGTVKAIYDIDLPRPRGAVQEIRFEQAVPRAARAGSGRRCAMRSSQRLRAHGRDAGRSAVMTARGSCRGTSHRGTPPPARARQRPGR